LAGNGGHVFQGTPQFFGQRQTGAFWSLPDNKIRSRPSRTLMGKIAEWVEQGVVQARSRYVALPEAAQLVLRETGAGVLELQVGALPAGLSLALWAGQQVARLRPAEGNGCLTLSVEGAPPGIVTLRLTSAATGATLELSAPWPARNGMILSPGNKLLERDTPLAIDALRGWRAISPASFFGEIQFRLDGRLSIAVRAEGELPLAAHMPLIRSMLAHSGPDAEVHLSMITGGQEGRRLIIRRYHRLAHIEGCFLHLRDGHTGQREISSGASPGDAVLRMVDLNAQEPVQVANRIEVQGALDLRSLLPEDGVWLIQATVNDEVLRAVVWSPHPDTLSTREERIAQYATTWTRLFEEPGGPEWERLWKLIQAVADCGDASVLDQVQALARAPAAAVELLLRVPVDAISQALALDMAAPIFWPAFPVTAFCKVTCDHVRHIRRYTEVLEDEQEARQAAVAALARRINAILTLRPELAGHFGAALLNTGLFTPCMHLENRDELLTRILVNAPDRRLAELAQDAARRFDRLPTSYGPGASFTAARPGF
jgi:hypothetical protein